MAPWTEFGVRSRGVEHFGHRSQSLPGLLEGVGARQDQRRNLGPGEEECVGFEVAGPRDDGDRRHFGLPAALPGMPLCQGHLRAGVVLDAHRGRADEDHVGAVTHEREHAAVTGTGETAGLAGSRGAAVEAGDHVGADPAGLQVVGVGVEVG